LWSGLLSLAALAEAADAPGLRLSKEGSLLLLPPPALLGGAEVKPRLTSGLTTTVSFEVTLRDAAGHSAKGGARVDVRYELWDEVFLVRGFGSDGRRFEASLPNFDRLAAWWRELEVPVVAARGVDPRGPWKVKVAARVIPFSQSEQRDAQRWLSDSVRHPGPANESGGAPDPNASGTGVLDLLVGTSIQRRALVGYDWNLTYSPERPERQER
jgi:hypothetical protein